MRIRWGETFKGELESALPSSVEEQADDAEDLNHLQNELRTA